MERQLWGAGYRHVVGMDEVGRGAWAGPLTVAAVVLPADRRVYGVRDSKQLTEVKREKLFGRLLDWCVASAVGHAAHEECDALGMSEAQRLAARRALEALPVEADMVLMDGRWNFVGGERSRTIVRGDATCLTIATASVVAKVTRDRIMRSESDNYPAYDFAANKGYPCPRHKAALGGYGPSAIHRRSWAFMDRLPWFGGRLTPADLQGRLFDDAGVSPSAGCRP